MSVDSKTVRGRRRVRYASFDELLADVERLRTSEDTRTLGNWPLEQLIAHLATTINACGWEWMT